MRRRPLFVGALVALVGAALILGWVLRGADSVPGEAAAPPTSPAAATGSPSPGADSTSTDAAQDPSATAKGATPGGAEATAEPPPSAPVQTSGISLQIPDIALDADLHAEGLRDGRINPPAGTVMWYTGHGRVAPGEIGTAVIAGHVTAGGQPDRFADLREVEIGDVVELTDADGSSHSYRVVRAEVVDKDDLTTDGWVWGENTSVERLAIVTCDDAFGFRGDGHRVANFVVIADRV